MTDMNDHAQALPERLHELDWIRSIVTIDLIPFHVAWLITSVGGFSLVEQWTPAWKILHGYVWLLSPVHMYLLFIVAGASTFLSLRRRSPGRYAVERVRRLLVPLLTFMVFLFPVLGWYWPSDIDLRGLDFLTQFWPWCLSTAFYSPVTHGPNWGHMWFAAYLFIYSMVLLPLFLRIRAGKSGSLASAAGFLTGRRGSIFLVGIPIALTFAVLAPIWPFFRNNLYSDWGYFTYNMTAFFLGFLIVSEPSWIRTFERHAAAGFVAGIALSVAKLYMQYRLPSYSTPAYTVEYAAYSAIAGFNTWAWVVAVLGVAGRTLSFTNRFLRWFSRISYPFYIFHLVAISVVGHFITRMRYGIITEFVLICIVSFVVSVVCCELVKRTPVTRFLFGIKRQRRRADAPITK
jgi:glucans biosynthesis protein C